MVLKLKEAPGKATKKAEPMPPHNPKRHKGSMPTSLGAAPIGMSEDRKSLYQEANEFTEKADETPAPEGDKPETEPTETTPEEVVTDTPSEKGDTKEETPAPEETPPEDGEKHTTVPHAALHEERKLHKDTKAKLNDALEIARRAQQQLDIMVQENARLRDAPVKKADEAPPVDEKAPIDDIEGYIRTMDKRIKSVEEENKRLKMSRMEELEDTRASKFTQAVDLVSNELKDQGYPGFNKFRHLVAERIEKEAAGDKNKLAALDNPESWAEIYRDKVYPEVAGIFGVKAKEAKKGEKEELKGKANLVGSPGKSPTKSEDEPKKPWGLTDYFDMRQKNRPT